MPDAQKNIMRHKLSSLLNYCETIQCRRQILLNYFGDSQEPCNNCDICLHPPKTIDATIVSQKLISCVYRTGQMFGAQYVIDVLLGKDDERIQKFGHDKISTFGIGSEYDRAAWQGIVRQLVSQNLLFVNMANHNELMITEQGADFLKTKRSIQLRLEEKPPRSKEKWVKEAANSADSLSSESDRQLLQSLKDLRLAIAREKNLPPYVIFHDKTLIDMVYIKPKTSDQLSMVHGVGQSKLEKYGAEFLRVINEAF